MCQFCAWMKILNQSKGKIFLLFLVTFIFIIVASVTSPRNTGFTARPQWRLGTCSMSISQQTITPLNGTKHLLVSAYTDRRVYGSDIRIIGIFKRDSIQPLRCLFCCAGELPSTPATVLQHSDNFGFPYVTTDVMCKIPPNCKAARVSLVSHPYTLTEHVWLPIRNQRTSGRAEGTLQFNITVCISSMFGGYNNVLQVTQSLEMYRLLGVDRVVIYNTSCSSDVDRLLRSYIQEGFLEVVPWPIDQHLTPSPGWLFSSSGGDLHYFGQLTTLNECVYRSMERSRYVLLNDIDEIIMPYEHKDLPSLMDTLQRDNPNTAEFLIENHIFPKTQFEPSGKFHLPQWNDVPGVNILEHIYREEPDRKIYHPHKMIIQPRMVEQTSVHEVLKMSGNRYKVPPNVCRIIHVRSPLQSSLTVEQLHVDKRLWDFHEKLVPSVDKVLERAGLLRAAGHR